MGLPSRFVVALVAMVVVFSVATGSAAQEVAIGEEPTEATVIRADGTRTDIEDRQDALVYASTYGVSLETASARLGLQQAVVELQRILAEQYSSSFAGLIEVHEPSHQILVFLADSSVSQELSQLTADTGLKDLVEAWMVPRTLTDLLGVAAAADAYFGGPVSRIDIGTNSVVVVLPTSRRDDPALEGMPESLSNAISMEFGELGGGATAFIYGGLGLSGGCTTGFSVYQVSNPSTKGITTAGHCSDSESYSGQQLPYQNGNVWASMDGQWHTAPGFTVKNWAYDGVPGGSTPYYRVISAYQGGNSYQGQFVCKYGVSTGYNCGTVVDTMFSPNWVPNSCACFLLVRKDGVDLSEPGDSGGPIYSGSMAIGTISGQWGLPWQGYRDLVYMDVFRYDTWFGVRPLTS